MTKHAATEIILIIVFFVFSWLLMAKSFGYDPRSSQFRIARHEVGDFGLHLSLIRSFSWGNNFPPESPFYPGVALPYHYYVDMAVGILERTGIRIDIALNGVSSIAFTALLFLIYKFSQLLFRKSRLLGIFSVVLFIFPSSTTFLDYFMNKPFTFDSLLGMWRIPDYIHKGPFDGSLNSIYFTLNVYLNQRHLIVGMLICLSVLYVFIKNVLSGKKISDRYVFILGLLLGVAVRVHSLIALGSLLSLVVLCVAFKRFRLVIPIVLGAALPILAYVYEVTANKELILSHPLFHFGFQSARPFSIQNVLEYWWKNMGLGILLIPLSLVTATARQRKIFLPFALLFIIANTLQLSYRIEHNHSLLNYFFIIANMYIARFLYILWQTRILGKCIALLLLFFLVLSGVLNIIPIKNDYQLTVADAYNNPFMTWIKDHTERNSVFLSRQTLLDPVTLAGRRNFIGAGYYTTVMGYDSIKRQILAQRYFEAETADVLQEIRKTNIHYVVIPTGPVDDFGYTVHQAYLDHALPVAYRDSDVIVYRL